MQKMLGDLTKACKNMDYGNVIDNINNYRKTENNNNDDDIWLIEICKNYSIIQCKWLGLIKTD